MEKPDQKQRVLFCQSCGFGRFAYTSNPREFCTRCGKETLDACTNCKTPLKDPDGCFCHGCGSHLQQKVLTDLDHKYSTTLERIHSFSNLTKISDENVPYLKPIDSFDELQFHFPRQFSSKDRLPVILKKKSEKIEFNLSLTPLSLLLFLSEERKTGGYKWLDIISEHYDELYEILSHLDITIVDDVATDYRKIDEMKNSFPAWVENRNLDSRKTVVTRINKEISKYLNGRLIVSIRAKNEKSVYSLIPSIKKITFL